MLSHQSDLFQFDAEPVPPYTASAAIYDHMMREVDYRGWAKYILQLMKIAGKESRKSKIMGEKLLEFGCGTANLSLIFSDFGFDVTGVDSSGDMLEVAHKKLARRNGNKLHLIRDNMVTFSSGMEFDRAFCVYDSINYIQSPEAVGRFFKAAFSSLKPGGVFVFDASMESNSLHDDSLFVQRGKLRSVRYHRKSQYDPGSKTHTTSVRIRKDGRVLEEVHREFVYEMAVLRNLFSAAGFEERYAAGDFTMLLADGNSERVHFVLVKPEHD